LGDITQLKGLTGNIVLVGCGSIGQAALLLLVRDLGVETARLKVVTADRLGVRLAIAALTPGNLQEAMGGHLRAGDSLLNLSIKVDSLELLHFANQQGALYLDTGIELLPGGYTDSTLSPGERSSQAFRAKALAVRDRSGPGRPKAVICEAPIRDCFRSWSRPACSS
jgi:homospermidine synthase